MEVLVVVEVTSERIHIILTVSKVSLQPEVTLVEVVEVVAQMLLLLVDQAVLVQLDSFGVKEEHFLTQTQVTLHQHFKFHFQQQVMLSTLFREHIHGHALLACHRYLLFA
jgi:hypothetical protein